jgi:hypothetical protein
MASEPLRRPETSFSQCAEKLAGFASGAKTHLTGEPAVCGPELRTCSMDCLIAIGHGCRCLQSLHAKGFTLYLVKAAAKRSREDQSVALVRNSSVVLANARCGYDR